MIPRLLTACAIAALTVGTEARAQQLPGWNPQTICVEDATPEHCGFLENRARTRISQQWQFIPSLVRERCLADSGSEDTRSWRLFGECLATAARPPRPGVQLAQATTGTQASDADGNLAEIQAIRAELEAARARMEELDAEREATSGIQARMIELQAELERSEEQRSADEARIDDLQQQLTAAIAARAVASSEAEDMAEMRASLDAALARAEEAEQRAATLQQDLAQAMADAETAQGATDEAGQARIAELEEALAKATTEVQRGTVRIEGLQTRLVEMSDAAMESGDETGDAGQDALRIEALEASLASAEAENERTIARNEELRARIVELMDALMTDEPEAEAEVAEPAPAPAPDTERVAELEAALSEARSEVERAASRIEGLQDRLVSAREGAARVGTALDDAAKTVAEKDERIASLEAELAKARSDMRNREVRIEGLQQRLMDASDAAAASMETADTGSDAVEALEGRLSVAESRIENLTARLRNARDAGKATASEKARAEDNLAKARTRIAALQDAMIEQRRMAEERAATGEAGRSEAIAASERLQALLDNQRARSERVAAIVSEQRGRIGDMEIEMRDLRRAARNAVAQTAPTPASCGQRIDTIMADGGIQFDNNKAEIRDDAARTIDRLIAVARDCGDTRLTVRGHTDALGERSYNLYLSQLRADAVVDYMERNGVAPDRVEGVGIGPDEPIADNRTRAGRAANRRIEIVVE